MSLFCTGLTVRFGATLALDGADIAVDAGEVVSLMGPSGSGKSTLLRVVAGLQQPDDGSVSWDGEKLDGVPPHARGFGLMFQDYALFPHRTVAGNVAFGLEMAGVERAAAVARIDEMLDTVGLGGYGERSIEGLSGGEQQRVALARTLAPSPRLVMLDEPVGSLDRQLRERIVVDMRRIFTDLGVTALYVTHDREEAFEIADRVAVMHRGAVLRIDSPERLWNDPGTDFVASFLGHENILDVVVAPGGGLLIAGVPVPAATPPGRVAIATDAIAVTDPHDATARGTVKGSVYRGTGYRTELEMPDGRTLVASTTHRPPPGKQVGVTIDDKGIMPLADSQ